MISHTIWVSQGLSIPIIWLFHISWFMLKRYVSTFFIYIFIFIIEKFFILLICNRKYINVIIIVNTFLHLLLLFAGQLTSSCYPLYHYESLDIEIQELSI